MSESNHAGETRTRARVEMPAPRPHDSEFMSDFLRHPNRSGVFPQVTQTLLIANAVIFLLQGLTGSGLMTTFALWPTGTPEYADSQFGIQQVPQFQLWQLVTYSFLHGGLFHLLINMFVLWMFGTQMELAWGARRFAWYYFACVIGAGLVQLLVTSMDTGGPIYPTVGASGGVYGLLLAFGMRFPNQYILLLIPPIPMKAKYFVIFIGAIELFFGATGTQAGVAHFAHLGGMAAGLLMILYWAGRLPWKPDARY